jgi:hypothetical protein
VQHSPRRVAFYECHQYFLRTACPALHDPTAPPDAQAETTGRGVWITKNVPILRIDYVSTKGKLLGMRQALYGGGVLDFKEMNRQPETKSPNLRSSLLTAPRVGLGELRGSIRIVDAKFSLHEL